TVFPAMESFLRQLAGKNYQNRKVGIIENGTWAPSAAKTMKDIISTMKNINLCENIVTIKSRLNETSREQMNNLATEILN
ncbi:MAG: FprA family A-type flavoprotein, partial [Clostridia bacterium]